MFVNNPYYVYINSRDRQNGTDENFSYAINFPTSYRQNGTSYRQTERNFIQS